MTGSRRGPLPGARGGWRAQTALLASLALTNACGGDGPTSPGGGSSGPANLAGSWTYRQQAPASCPLPTSHRSLTFPATLTAQGGNVFVMTLSGTDAAASYSYFYWAGSGYRGNILYSRATGSEFAVFTVNEAPFSVSGSTMSASPSGQYQYIGASLVNCTGTFTITLTR